MTLKKKLMAYMLLLATAVTSSGFTAFRTNDVYAAGNNLALKKPTYASGTYNETTNYSDDKINDGNYHTLWSDGGVRSEEYGTYTGQLAGYYYIAVDLTDSYIINQIIAYPRIDFNDSDMLHNWYIQLANERDFSDAITVAHIESKCEFGGNFVFNVESENSFRYVRIASPKAYFTCGELEVFGEQFDPEIMSGEHTFIDTQDKTYNAAAVICDALDIIKATGKASFGGEKMMTRAAACEAVVTMMGYSTDLKEKSIFLDVPNDHYAKDYIMAAYENNLIAKSDYFRPDEYITQGEFCKMIIYAFGYGSDAAKHENWRFGISDVSKSLKLLKFVESSFDDYLNRGTAAQIIYNALKAPLNNLEFGKTISRRGSLVPSKEPALYTLYELNIVEGVMTENSASTLTHPTEKRKDRIVIGDTAYLDNGGLMQKMLGRQVGVLVNEDGDVLAGFEDVVTNEVTKVYNSSFVSANGGIYQYTEEGKDNTKRIKFNPSEVYVLRNYAAIPDWTYADLEPGDGYIEFIDNDRDGEIEIILVMKPEVVLGGYILPLDGDLNVVGQDGSKVAVEEPVWSRFMRNGKVTTPGKFLKNDVFYVYKSSNDAMVLIEGYTNSIRGVVTNLDEEYVTIGDREYRLSDYYKEMVRTNALAKKDWLLRLGENMAVALDDRDNVICVIKEEIKVEEDIIGFVAKIYTNDFDGTGSMRVFTEKGSFATYEFAEKTTINDRTIKKLKLITEIKDGAIVLKDKMIKFRVNNLEEVYRIEILEDSGIVLGDNSVYINNGYGIYSKGWMVQPLLPDTLCFTLPRNASGYLYSGYEQHYVADEVSDHMSELSQIDEKWTFYDVDDLGFPSLAVRYKEVASYGAGLRSVNSFGKGVDGMIVKSVNKYCNEENEMGYRIKGLDMSGSEKTVFLETDITTIFKADDLQADKFDGGDSDPFNNYKDIITDNLSEQDVATYSMNVDDLKTGDIIRYEMNDGMVIALERTFEAYSGQDGVYQRPTDGTYYSAGRTYPQFPDAEYRLVYGKTKKIVDDTFIMTTCEKDQGKGPLNQYVSYLKLGRLIVCSGNQIDVYDGNVLPAYFKANQEAVLYTADRAKPTCLIVYE